MVPFRVAVALAGLLVAGRPGVPAMESGEGDDRVVRIVAGMVARNEQRLEDLREYTARRRYQASNERFGQCATVEVLERYEYPGRKRLEIEREEGSDYIRKKVIQRLLDSEMESSEDDRRDQTQITPRYYTFALLGEIERKGRATYVIEIEPREKKELLIRGRIWVDAEELAIVRMEGSPVKKPSFWVTHAEVVREYEKHGPFWLPSSMESTSQILLAGPSRLRVEYSDYEIVRSAVTTD
ncbi:MAG: hypothetical protein GC160_04790 [Acidobacteria bacterium]|nr:hypothetical protein [Acidobacteriota bacterium]